MSVIVTDTGFSKASDARTFTALSDLPANDTPCCLDMPSDADPFAIKDRLAKFQMIRIDFPSFADGRGFTIARQLRLLGFTGTLRARGHVIADQYAMARRSGFDEVEINDDLATRQPEPQWLARANWQNHDYQSRLRAAT